jgi:hypothetical protein
MPKLAKAQHSLQGWGAAFALTLAVELRHENKKQACFLGFRFDSVGDEGLCRAEYDVCLRLKMSSLSRSRVLESGRVDRDFAP